MTRSPEFEDKLKQLPSSPGVYLMKNSDDKVIYVGKSKCLKNRVSSYFQSYHSLNYKTQKLVERIYNFDIIVTSTEAEALILENELIKRHNPKYNIKLKDAKTYPYIRISNENKYPRLVLSRKRGEKNGKYFGPYTSAIAAKDIIKTVEKTFRIPNCGKSFVYGKQICRPCLSYHLGQCCAPCTGKVTAEEYNELISAAEKLLKGDTNSVRRELEEKMLNCSENLMFEEAASYRDSINNLDRLLQKQKVVSAPKNEEDYFGYYESEDISCIAVLKVRNGVINDKDIVFLSPDEISDSEALEDMILRYYDNFDLIPRSIFTSFSLQDGGENLSAILSELAEHSVDVHHPEKGDKKALCQMAVKNAEESSNVKRSVNEHDELILAKIANLLELECLPERIECYDVSNSGDSDMYAGMIVLENARFAKSKYRSFSIKSLSEQNDYHAMTEAISRRMAHVGKNDDESMNALPDLILLDGGVGHVNTIKAMLSDIGVYVPVFGMVKDDYHKTRTLTDGENEISIAKDQSIFSFFYRIQEEVHRFTFSKMDASRRNKVKSSSLTNIPGVGPSKAKALLSHFKTISAIKSADAQKLCEVPGISESVANNIIQYFNTENTNENNSR